MECRNRHESAHDSPPSFSEAGAMATAERAASPETIMPGTYIAPIKRNIATVEIVPKDTHRRREIRVRRLDTVALMERMRSRIDGREAGIVNAFIASGIVSKAVVKTPKRLPIPLLTIPDSIPLPSLRNSVWQPCWLCQYVCNTAYLRMEYASAGQA